MEKTPVQQIAENIKKVRQNALKHTLIGVSGVVVGLYALELNKQHNDIRFVIGGSIITAFGFYLLARAAATESVLEIRDALFVKRSNEDSTDDESLSGEEEA